MKNARVLVLSLAIISSTGFSEAGKAATMCSAPLEPLCIGQDTTFENDATTVRCRADVDRFVEQTEAYLTCLRTTIRETEAKLDDVVKRFEERSDR